MEKRTHEMLFKNFLMGREVRVSPNTFVSGTQSPTYSEGPLGGFLVPQKFDADAVEGMALVDTLLDPNIVTVFSEPDFTLRPLSIPGWDLSQIAATKVGETSQESAGSVPAVSGKLLGKFTYRLALDCSLEFDEDAKAYGSAESALARATGVG